MWRRCIGASIRSAFSHSRCRVWNRSPCSSAYAARRKRCARLCPKITRRRSGILRDVAPRWGEGFTALVLPDFVGLYGLEDFDRSLDALSFSPHSVRRSLPSVNSSAAISLRTLRVMTKWSRDDNEHVRRLASEGCRPRLPWSFKLRELIADPSPVAPILDKLRADPSLYVRKSVANHLNDITKDHPAWVLDRIGGWDLENKHTAWIAKRALRTMIKKGDRRALTVIGALGPVRRSGSTASPSARTASPSATI